MIPTLFAADYIGPLVNQSQSFPGRPTFEKHGIVDLVDCISCVAAQTEDESSEWELEMVYPLGGQGFSSLEVNRQIVVKANHWQDPQAFRIYAIQKNINKTVTVKAQHISYDLANVPMKPFKAGKGTNTSAVQNAISKLRNNNVYDPNNATPTVSNRSHYFRITTNMSGKSSDNETYELKDPKSMRAVLIDGDESIKGTYGGDLVIDNYDIQLLRDGGTNRDVTIRYGVDLIDMEQEKNIGEMITGILPYVRRGEDDESYDDQPIIYGDVTYGSGTYAVQRVVPVDLTEFFPYNLNEDYNHTGTDETKWNFYPDKPGTTNYTNFVDALNAKAKKYVTKERIGVPKISLTVSFALLGQNVRMHDQLRVIFPDMNVDTSAKVVKYTYNCLLEKIEEVELDHARGSKYFNLMSASRLRKGLIPPERIKNESINNSKISKGGVGGGKVNKETIDKRNIKPRTIDHDLLSGHDDKNGPAVTSDNIGDGEVKNDNIGTGAVTAPKLSSVNDASGGAVTTSKVRDLQITFNKLAESLGDEITSINAMKTQLAYIDKLFGSTAEVDFIRARAMYGNTIEASTSLSLAGNATFYYHGASVGLASVVDTGGYTRQVLYVIGAH